MATIKPGVWLDFLGLGRPKPWRVRWADPNGSTPSRCFSDEDEARQFGISAYSVVISKQAEGSMVGQAIGQRGILIEEIPKFITSVRSRCRFGAHAKNIRSHLKSLLQFRNLTYVDEITYHVLEGFQSAKSHRYDSGRGPVGSVKQFLRAMALNDKIICRKALLFNTFGLKRDPILSGIWNDEQVEKILLDLDADNRAPAMASGYGNTHNRTLKSAETRRYFIRKSFAPVFFILIRCGMRPVEACRLNVENWDTEKAILNLPQSITKTGFKRSLAIDPTTADVLNKLAQNKMPNDALFTPPSSDVSIGDRWTVGRMYRACRGSLKRLHLPGTLYWARHTYCTHIAQLYSNDLGKAMELTGHRDISQFRRYLHARDKTSSVLHRALEEKDINNAFIKKLKKTQN